MGQSSLVFNFRRTYIALGVITAGLFTFNRITDHQIQEEERKEEEEEQKKLKELKKNLSAKKLAQYYLKKD